VKPPRTLGLAPKTTDAMVRYVQELISKSLSNISFGTTTSNADADMNMQCYKATGTTPVGPNTAFTVNHNLKHVPFGFSVLRTNIAAHIYDSGVAWTAATNSTLGTISLKCDQASVVFTIVIF
jgi:hypothetical protein